MKSLTLFVAASAAALASLPADEAEKELHVVGLYQGAGHITGQNNQGTATIEVNRPGKSVTLFLSSYDPVLWRVTVADGTQIEKVFLDGYYNQEIAGLPIGTPVIETTYEGGMMSYLVVGYTLEDPRTLAAIPQIEDRTGMKIASFHGTYEAPPEAMVVDAIQNDPRLDSEWPRPVPPDQVPALEFQLSFWESGVSTRLYTLQGPVGGGALFPNAMAVVPDSQEHFYYGGDSDPFRFDAETGHVEDLPVPAPLPEVSWPRGAAFDTHRDRAVLVTLGGEGFLYGFSPETKTWSVISDMNNVDADSIAYHAPDDSFYVVLNSYSTSHPPTVQRLSAANGSELGRIRLPPLSFEIVSHYDARSEIVSVGEYLVLLLSQARSYQQSWRADSRIYLIDPRTGEVTLTYRQVAGPPPPPPPPKFPAFPHETNIVISEAPPPPHADAVRPWWSARVELTFDRMDAEVTKWGELAREGDVFSVDVEAVHPATELPTSPHSITHRRDYSLGGLTPRSYKFRVTSRGLTLGEKDFTVPPEDEVKANVTLTVDTHDPQHVTARAHIEFQDYFAVTAQSAVRRDEFGRYILEAKAERVGVIAVFPPPPFPIEDLTFDLGAVPPGPHNAIFRMNGETYAEAEFVVGDPPPDKVPAFPFRTEITVSEGPRPPMPL